MFSFLNKEIDMLVCTTIIESGLDIASANTIIVNRADRFGLAQMYQLRGRVGRGSDRGVCFLMASANLSENALSRLKVLVDHRDGFEIARKDLEYRGHGELIGMKQTGLGEVDLSEMMREPDLLLLAKEKADRLLSSDPELADPRHHALKSFVESVLTKPIDI